MAIVVLENREASQVIGDPEAPYLNQLAKRYGLATQSYGQTHPSLPNYLTLIGGTAFGVTSDCTSCSVEGTTLVDQLNAKGIGWKAYMEGMPKPCYTGGDVSAQSYGKRHDPFVYVRHLVSTPADCNRVVPYSQLSQELATGSAPPFIWITPNSCNDGHDCPTATTDKWMSSNLPELLSSSWYKDNGVVIVTWDEGTSNAGCCNGEAAGGRIPTIVVSARTPAGARSAAPVDQAGTLATIEDLFGLGHLGQAGHPASGNLLSLVGAGPRS